MNLLDIKIYPECKVANTGSVSNNASNNYNGNDNNINDIVGKAPKKYDGVSRGSKGAEEILFNQNLTEPSRTST